MFKLFRIGLLLLLLALANSVHSSYVEMPGSGFAAEINSLKIPSEALDIYFNFYREKDTNLTKASLLKNLISNSLVAKHALSTVGESNLKKENRVGFNVEVRHRDLFLTMIDSYFSSKISKYLDESKISSLDALISHKNPRIIEHVNDVLSKADKSFVKSYSFNEKQKNESKNVQLLAVQFPGMKEQSISLWDIYKEGNVQDKIAIHKLELSEIEGLIERKLRSMFLSFWIDNASGLSEETLQIIKQLIHDNYIVGRYYRYTGFKAGIHDDNAGLKRMMQSVTQKEVEEYYWHYKDEFITKLKVLARHITLRSQAEADKAKKELEGGLDFNKAVQKYSINPDRFGDTPGNMGWISRNYADNWLASIVFAQPYQKVSAPFMSPRKQGQDLRWEIVLVDDIEMGYFKPGSETVRYKASREIAKMKIKQHHASLLETVHSENSIKISNVYYDAVVAEPLIEYDLFDLNHDHKH